MFMHLKAICWCVNGVFSLVCFTGVFNWCVFHWSALSEVPCTLRKKEFPSSFFWCFSLSQIGGSSQYLEGPNSTWKDHDRNIFCSDVSQYSYDGPSRYYLVLPGTDYPVKVTESSPKYLTMRYHC